MGIRHYHSYIHGTFLIVSAYTFYAKRQAEISEAANYNFIKANRDNGRTVTLTLGKMQNQIDQMSRLANGAENQAERTKTIADQAVVQANAAKSAAETAKETLDLSERAYITVTGMGFEFASGNVKS